MDLPWKEYKEWIKETNNNYINDERFEGWEIE